MKPSTCSSTTVAGWNNRSHSRALSIVNGSCVCTLNLCRRGTSQKDCKIFCLEPSACPSKTGQPSQAALADWH